MTESKRFKKLLLIFLLFALISGCNTFWKDDTIVPPAHKERTFAKAKALMASEKYAEAEPFFLSLTAEPEANDDLIYDLSLWNISLIYEKLGSPEKSILALQLLLDRKSPHIFQLKLNASLMKNYFRVGNKLVAMKYKKFIDDENPKLTINSEKLYLNLLQTLDLNFDQLVVEELDYVGEVQKYLLYVMEQNQSNMNQHATELLISLYERAYAVALKDTTAPEFKEKILVALLDKLRQFELFKMNDVPINSKTVAKFSTFAGKLEKKITDRLHK